MDADKTIIIQLLLQLRVKDPEAVAMLTPTSAEVYVIVFCVLSTASEQGVSSTVWSMRFATTIELGAVLEY